MLQKLIISRQFFDTEVSYLCHMYCNLFYIVFILTNSTFYPDKL